MTTETRFGLVDRVRNTHSGKKYTVSTVRDPKTGFWQTAVLEGSMLSRLRKRRFHETALFSGSLNETEARYIHESFRVIAQNSSPSDFEKEKKTVLDKLDSS